MKLLLQRGQKNLINLINHYPVTTTLSSSPRRFNRSTYQGANQVRTRVTGYLVKLLMKFAFITHRDSLLRDPTIMPVAIVTYLTLKRPAVVGEICTIYIYKAENLSVCLSVRPSVCHAVNSPRTTDIDT